MRNIALGHICKTILSSELLKTNTKPRTTISYSCRKCCGFVSAHFPTPDIPRQFSSPVKVPISLLPKVRLPTKQASYVVENKQDSTTQLEKHSTTNGMEMAMHTHTQILKLNKLSIGSAEQPNTTQTLSHY